MKACSLVMIALLGAAAAAAPRPGAAKKPLTAAEISKAEKAVKDHLESIKGGYMTVSRITAPGLEKALPEHAFFFVLYRRLSSQPRITPKALGLTNVFVWGRDGKLSICTLNKQLEQF
jgi:hypothetical protein